ncbi:MAG: hypothetical protein GWN58_46950, partial [Anaerolineae bacterium]|nr:hypothetical protein [Anaerolineae bacterium]
KGVAYTLLLSAASFLEWPVAQLMLPGQRWLFASAVLIRTLLMLGLLVEFGLALFPPARRRIRREVLGLPVIIALVGVVVTGGLALRAYFVEQYADDPYRGVMDLLREQDDAGIVVANESLYHRFYPFLGPGAGLRWVDGGEHSREQLAKLATGRDVLWVVDIGTEAERAILPEIEQWLSERYYPIDNQWLDSSRLGSYATGEALL